MDAGIRGDFMKMQNRILSLAALLLLAGTMGRAATLTGTVKGTDGAPFQGAFVEAQNVKSKINVIVLSDRQGQYRIENLPAGDYRLQIRAVGFKADPVAGVSLAADKNASYDFALQQGMVHWNDISMYQAKQLLPAAKGKDLIVARCDSCHLFQTRMASVTRDEDGWKDRLQYMRKVLHVSVSEEDANEISSYLATVFGPDSVLPKSPADMPGYKSTLRPLDSDGLKLVYVEYDMPGPTRMPFSAAPDKDGNIWIPNFGVANKITRLDPKTGAMQDFSVPNLDSAMIHSAVPAPNGTVWLAETDSNRLGEWDPATQKITEYQDAFIP
jgi:cytochrome c5